STAARSPGGRRRELVARLAGAGLAAARRPSTASGAPLGAGAALGAFSARGGVVRGTGGGAGGGGAPAGCAGAAAAATLAVASAFDDATASSAQVATAPRPVMPHFTQVALSPDRSRSVPSSAVMSRRREGGGGCGAPWAEGGPE